MRNMMEEKSDAGVTMKAVAPKRKPARKPAVPEQHPTAKQGGRRVRRLSTTPVSLTNPSRAQRPSSNKRRRPPVAKPLPSMVTIPPTAELISDKTTPAERESSETSIMSDFSSDYHDDDEQHQQDKAKQQEDQQDKEQVRGVQNTFAEKRNAPHSIKRTCSLDKPQRPSNARRVGRKTKATAKEKVSSANHKQQQQQQQQQTMRTVPRSQSTKSMRRDLDHDKEHTTIFPAAAQLIFRRSKSAQFILAEPSLRTSDQSSDIPFLEENSITNEDGNEKHSIKSASQDIILSEEDPPEQLPENFWRPTTTYDKKKNLRRVKSDKALLSAKKSTSRRASTIDTDSHKTTVVIQKEAIPLVNNQPQGSLSSPHANKNKNDIMISPSSTTNDKTKLSSKPVFTKSNSLRDLLGSVFQVRPLFQRSSSWNNVSLFSPSAHDQHDALASVASMSEEFSLELSKDPSETPNQTRPRAPSLLVKSSNEQNNETTDQKTKLRAPSLVVKDTSSSSDKANTASSTENDTPQATKSTTKRRFPLLRSLSADRIFGTTSSKKPNTPPRTDYTTAKPRSLANATSSNQPQKTLTAQPTLLRSSSTPNLLSRMEQIVVREQYEAEQQSEQKKVQKKSPPSATHKTLQGEPQSSRNRTKDLTRIHSGRSLSSKNNSHKKKPEKTWRKRRSRRNLQETYSAVE